jgi:hypothetical protein
MNFLTTFFVLMIILISRSESIVLDCDYKDYKEYGYGCWIQNSIENLKTDREISEVRGQHLSGKGIDDVKSFISYTKTLNFFPQNLTKFFKNIDTVWIQASKLQEISKKDLKQFGRNLRNLWLDWNEIEVIEGNLFEFNPNLEHISLYKNKMVHIGSGAFDRLEKLRELNLKGNPCTRRLPDYYTIPSRIIREVEKSCKS